MSALCTLQAVSCSVLCRYAICKTCAARLTVQEVVVDPVSIQDGSTYERSSIQRWFMHNSTSPMTGLNVDTRVVVPNSMVRTVAGLFHRHKGSAAC
jgi:U-box domain